MTEQKDPWEEGGENFKRAEALLELSKRRMEMEKVLHKFSVEFSGLIQQMDRLMDKMTREEERECRALNLAVGQEDE